MEVQGLKGATPSISGKAGWVKKSSGKLLGSYKERYMKVEKTELVVYRNQDLQTCLERVDLEKYDKCLEVRSPFKKKNRLVLIRAHKSGSKVHDVKLQVENVEEKEAWIKALGDAINRAKNKIFDEVKVDESCSLDHVTRSRPRGNCSRRPPTRIHMKEVASISSDGILRLDLDMVDQMPNGAHEVSIVAAEVSDTNTDATPQLPMPLSKLSKNLQETMSEEQKATPMPPSKNSKPGVPWEEVMPVETAPNGVSEPAASETPLHEPSDSASSPSPPLKNLTPPVPLSKDKKPTQAVEHNLPEHPSTEDHEEDSSSESQSDTLSITASEGPVSEAGPSPNPSDMPITLPEDMPTSPAYFMQSEQEVTGEQELPSEEEVTLKHEVPSEQAMQFEQEVFPKQEVLSEQEVACEQEVASPALSATEPTASVPRRVSLEAQDDAGPAHTQLTKPAEPSSKPIPKGPGPPAPPKKKPLKLSAVSDQSYDRRDRSEENPFSVETVIPLDNCVSGKAGPELLVGLSNENAAGLSQEARSSPYVEQEEMKSVDSDQHSHDGSENCTSLEEDMSEGDTPATRKPPQSPAPIPVGGLLSEWGETCPDVDDHSRHVAQELQTTQELGEACRREGRGSCGEGGASVGPLPEELLMKAVEKLHLAELCLRKASTLKLCDPPGRKGKRTSW